MKLREKIMLALFALTAQTAAFASIDKPVTLEQLPATAQQTIKQSFGGNKIALAKMEYELFGRSYDIIFTNGDKIEFDRKGQWTSVQCKSSQIPSELVPEAIAAYVKNNYPDLIIKSIERDRKNYDVDLSNGLELSFDKTFHLIDIDD